MKQLLFKILFSDNFEFKNVSPTIITKIFPNMTGELYTQSLFKPELEVFNTISKKKILCEFICALTFVFFANWSYISFRLSNQSAASYGTSVG